MQFCVVALLLVSAWGLDPSPARSLSATAQEEQEAQENQAAQAAWEKAQQEAQAAQAVQKEKKAQQVQHAQEAALKAGAVGTGSGSCTASTTTCAHSCTSTDPSAGHSGTVADVDFTFVADNAMEYGVKISAAYNSARKTYNFPTCKNQYDQKVCYHNTCMGRCGAGCGNEEMEHPCTPLDMINTIEFGQGKQCRTRCLNHDLCGYTRDCRGSVAITKGDCFGNSFSCELVKIIAFPETVQSLYDYQLGESALTCPANFKGYSKPNDLMKASSATKKWRQKLARVNISDPALSDINEVLMRYEENPANQEVPDPNAPQIPEGPIKIDRRISGFREGTDDIKEATNDIQTGAAQAKQAIPSIKSTFAGKPEKEVAAGKASVTAGASSLKQGLTRLHDLAKELKASLAEVQATEKAEFDAIRAQASLSPEIKKIAENAESVLKTVGDKKVKAQNELKEGSKKNLLGQYEQADAQKQTRM